MGVFQTISSYRENITLFKGLAANGVLLDDSTVLSEELRHPLKACRQNTGSGSRAVSRNL